MFILKIGGSVITDKSRNQTFKPRTMNRLSKEIKDANKEMILIHGAGSFGHVLAKEYNLKNGYKNKEQLKGFSLTHLAVQKLNSLVLDSLHKNDIPAVSISAHSIVKLDNHKISKIDFKIFEDYLDMHFLPVTFGDVVLDESLGFSICSGDLLVSSLAEYFKPEKVIFVIDEDGLYTSNPKVDRNAKFIERIEAKYLEKLITTLDTRDDVTGGMKGKIEAIKKISKQGIDTILLNGNKPERLYKALVGEDSISTVVYGE